MRFSDVIAPLVLMGSLALAALPLGSGPKINGGPSFGSGPRINEVPSSGGNIARDVQDGSVVISSYCGAGTIYISAPSGETTLGSKMPPIFEPYPAVNEAASIRITRTKDDRTVSITPVFQIDYTRTSEGQVQYDTFNIDGNPFEKEGLTVICGQGGATPAEETGSCSASSDLTITLCSSYTS